MLRQREWVILTRPYYKNSTGTNIYYEEVPQADESYFRDDGDGCVSLKGVAEGMEVGSLVPIDKGGWVMWYKTTSFRKLREKYKECLSLVGKEMTKVVEMIPVDTMVTPIS